MKSDSPSSEDSAKTDNALTSLALQVHYLQAMVDFYTEAFGIQFHQVNAGGFLSQFGTFNGLTIKFVPIRESVDFGSLGTQGVDSKYGVRQGSTDTH